MTALGSIDDNSQRSLFAPAFGRRSAVAPTELAQLEKQLSEWVHCASAKTQAGMEKIAEISSKINAIKEALQQQVVQDSRADDSGAGELAAARRSPIRLDGAGAWISLQA